MKKAFDDAVGKARDFFLFDCKGVFERTHTWFRTKVRNNDGVLNECFTFPFRNQRMQVGLILPCKNCMRTHKITRRNGDVYEARIMIRIRSETDETIDPFHFKYGMYL